MIQKLIGNTLYVLKKDPYKITRDLVDASIIYCNCNTIDGFRLLNPELELTPYNYLLLRKSEPIYWPYVDMKDNAEFYFDQGIQNVSSYVDQTYSGVRQEPIYPSDLDVSLLFYFDDVLMDSSAFILTDASSYKIKAEIKDSSKYDDEVQEYLINYEKVKRTGTLSFNTASYEVSTYADENWTGQVQQVNGVPAGQTVNYYLGNSLLSGDSITLTEPGFYVVSARLEDSSIYNDTSTSYTISYQKQKRTATLSFVNAVVEETVEDVTEYSGNVQTVSGLPTGVTANYYLGNTLLSNGVISINNLEEGENTFTITAKIENNPVYNDAQASYTLSITMEITSYENKYLTFEALEDGTFKFAQKTVSYSTDNGKTWTELPANTSTGTIHQGEKILWKGNNTSYQTSNGQIRASNKFNVEGNIMSLVYGDNFIDQKSLQGKNNVFSNFFYYRKTLINAENLVLPATILADSCYYSMFSSCSSLIKAPELPATTLANNCYEGMFSACTSLTTAPELPATTLANNCYKEMFSVCTSLVNAPELHATTLYQDCYNCMFSHCTSLTTAPELPATTLANSCYYGMFSNCSSLTTAPELPATTLKQDCYRKMFSICTSLTTAPELPATTLIYNCYGGPSVSGNLTGMFAYCTSLNYIKAACPPNSETYKSYWVYNVSSTGTYVISDPNYNPNTDGIIYSKSCVPVGWVIKDYQGNVIHPKQNANISFTNSVVYVSTYVNENYTGTLQSLNGVPSGVTPKYYLDSSLLSSNNITLTTTGNHTVVGAIENDANYNDTSTSYTINYQRVKQDVSIRGITFSSSSGQTFDVDEQVSVPTVTYYTVPGVAQSSVQETYSFDGNNYVSQPPSYYLDTSTAGNYTYYVKFKIPSYDLTYNSQEFVKTWEWTVASSTPVGTLTVIYNVTNLNEETQLFRTGGGSSSSSESGSSESGAVLPTSMTIDGVEETPVSTWRFSTASGEHEVVYTFENNTIPPMFLCENSNIVSILINNLNISDDSADNGVFMGCSFLTDVQIYSSVGIDIGSWAFGSCFSLSNVYLYQVKTINDYAFYNCYNLSSITIDTLIPPYLGNEALNLIPNLKIYVPDESVEDYKGATNWQDYASQIYPISEYGPAESESGESV